MNYVDRLGRRREWLADCLHRERWLSPESVHIQIVYEQNYFENLRKLVEFFKIKLN